MNYSGPVRHYGLYHFLNISGRRIIFKSPSNNRGSMLPESKKVVLLQLGEMRCANAGRDKTRRDYTGRLFTVFPDNVSLLYGSFILFLAMFPIPNN